MSFDAREWRLRLREDHWTVDLQRHPSRPNERIVTVVPKSRLSTLSDEFAELLDNFRESQVAKATLSAENERLRAGLREIKRLCGFEGEATWSSTGARESSYSIAVRLLAPNTPEED